MKKSGIIWLLCVLILMLSGCIQYGPAAAIESECDYFERQCAITLPPEVKGQLLFDSHGGSASQGESMYLYQFSDNAAAQFQAQLSQSFAWFELPYVGEVEALLGQTGAFAKNLKLPDLTKIENGYYYVRDRYAQQDSDQKRAAFGTRDSLNISIAVYSTDEKALYLYEIDR